MGVMVFAYGSLMWNPGFEFVSSRPALLEGWQRSWCVRSTFYRGCADNHGYVLGLARGGSCVGIAFEVDTGAVVEVLDAIHQREMRESGYQRAEVTVTCGRERFAALTYTSEGSPEPCARDLERAYLTAAGQAGPNREYIDQTRGFLRRISLHDGLSGIDDALPKAGFWDRAAAEATG